MREFLMADVFAGCGGFSLGMEKAGFTHGLLTRLYQNSVLHISTITTYQMSTIMLETYVN